MEFSFRERAFDRAIAQAKAALLDQKLTIVAEVSTSTILNKAGYNVPPVHQIFFFKPDFMNGILTQSVDLIMAAPIKMVIMQSLDGAIKGLCSDPEVVFAGAHDCKDFARDLRDRVTKAVATL